MAYDKTAGVEDINTEALLGPDALRKEVEDMYTQCIDFYRPWEEQAKEDYRFALGDQWTEEDKTKLKEQGRPVLTFNRIKPLINLISGYQRRHSARIKVSPEGGEDKIFSEVFDKLQAAVDKWSHLNHTLGYMFDDGCYCGKGFIEAFITYDSDPIRGELSFELRSPYQILVDKDYKNYDLNRGCKGVLKVMKMTRLSLIELFPDKEDVIRGIESDSSTYEDVLGGVVKKVEGDHDDYGNRPTAATKITKTDTPVDLNPKLTLKEYWYPRRVERFFVMDIQSGKPKRFDKKEDAEEFAAEQGPSFKVIMRKVQEMWVTDWVCGVQLQDIKSPFEPYYSGFPFFRFLADWAPNAEAEEYRTQGMVRSLKDPQKEKNKSKSQALHILNTQANSGWIGEEGALTPTGWQDLKKMGSTPGVTVKVNAGFYEKIREIQPKTTNPAFRMSEEKADEEFTQISGINPDLLGLKDDTASGRAIFLRIKQGVMSLMRLFSNYKYTKEILGTFILQVSPMLFDTRKVMKVIGPEYMRKAVSDKYPEGLSEGHIAAFLQMVGDNKYDVYVAEADEAATLRGETFMEIMELVKAGVQIPINFIIDYMDVPNADEIKEAIAKQQAEMVAVTAGKGAPGAR